MLKRARWLFVAAAVTVANAQDAPSSRAIEVSETAGIRRTEYPVNAQVELPRGVLRDVANARLRRDASDVPAQFTADATWDDGSTRTLGVDFNVSIGPLERRPYVVEFGPGVKSSAPSGRGLSVSEEADAIQAGSFRFSRTGAPPVVAANYFKTNFVGTGRNGLAVIDRGGVRHEVASAQGVAVTIVKPGPLKAVLRYTGRLTLDASTTLPFEITLEMPNSKSWLKMSATVQDPAARIRQIAFDSPLAFASLPLTWDFGTENGTYGAFRNATDTAVLQQTVNAKGPTGWTVGTGTEGATLNPYEASVAPGRSHGTGHLVDARGAVAFGFADFGKEPGVYRIALTGGGQASFSFEPARPAKELRLTVYQHFVPTPVPIGAATSPAAMLNPLKVVVK